MILAAHIIIALSSIVFSLVTAFSPSSIKLKFSYTLAGGTLGTGILLVVVEPKTMVQACISGLIYFSVVSFIIAMAQRKLSGHKISID